MTMLLSAGNSYGGLPVYANVQGLGTTPYSSVGQTTTLPDTSTIVYSSIFLPRNMTLTGAAILHGAATSGSMIVTLYDQTGARLARSATAGTAQTSSNAFQRVPFTVVTAVSGPGLFWLGVLYNTTNSAYRAVSSNSYIDVYTGTTFSSSLSHTPNVSRATSFTAFQGPIGYVYI